ncbi:zona pellucida glycoprotein 3d tandem duplicate 1 [Pangasianodon hypophthalmus]|uniref:zona pellucida glycoprotein 3d tandem duplicate 1 n=1 Tax=Pangasianodon hypophthalmus TaxID=310915 RepID=UPI0023078E8B|nr:zona pellucida glycoprotein 3d tandem duplicate 1 [Pangasianodon hypophthalmus]
MGGARLLFSLHVCVFGLLGCVVDVAGRGDDQRYSTITSQEQELYTELRPEIRDSDVIHPPPPPPPPPYLLLPMFRHHSAPAVSKELFSPVARRRVLPRVLSNILIPQVRQPHIRVTPVNNNHGVEVWCGYSKVSVRINQALLSFRSSAAHFRLGTCPASRADGSVLYFQYELNECGSVLSVINGQLLYANELLYRPASQGAVIRAVPLVLPIQCVYDRFHYSYKIGYLPELRPQSFQKTLVRKHVFSLSVRNDKWEELRVNKSYVLGEPMYFEVNTGIISKDKSVYVEACHVTASEDSNSTQRYDVISNFGCMVDSKRTGSQSRYVSRKMNILRFSLDAFSFAEAASERFYLHCTVLVGNASASTTAKSCTYSESEHRWEELDGDAAVCSCCDSQCRPPGFNASSCVEQAVVTSKPWSLIHSEVLPETSDEWLNTVLGSVLLHHHHRRPEGEEEEESQEEEEEEEEEEEIHEKEELCVGEELEEEVLIGVAESENDEMMMTDEGMEEGDAGNMAEDGEKEKKEDVDVQKEEGEMQKNVTDFVAKFSEGIWEDEESLKENVSVYVTAAETDLGF